jgi:hypothetical protein
MKMGTFWSNTEISQIGKMHNMKHILIIILILLPCFLYSQDKDSLNVRKTELEIQKSEQEVNDTNSLKILSSKDSLDLK